jgi:hypothetical protein
MKVSLRTLARWLRAAAKHGNRVTISPGTAQLLADILDEREARKAA